MTMPLHEERVIANSRAQIFPESPLGITSPLNKYLNHLYVLGDPHLGRRFTAGVPLARRGEREAEIRELFHSEVVCVKPGRQFHVCMGDLFDGWTVDNETVEFAYRTYKEASWRNPSITYIVLGGNHDKSKDKTKVSSFQIFAELCRDLENVHVLTDTIMQRTFDGLNFLFVPWVPWHSSNQQLFIEQPKFMTKGEDFKFIALGHWDIEDYGKGDDEVPGLIPWQHLKAPQCEGIITGHFHKRQRTIMNGIDVFVSGSMAPYAHGEDDDNAEDPQYLTLPRAEVLSRLEADPEAFASKCLRVLLADDEEPLADINCLQLTMKRGAVGKNADAVLDVKVDDFSLKALFDQVMSEKGVSESLTRELWEKL